MTLNERILQLEKQVQSLINKINDLNNETEEKYKISKYANRLALRVCGAK